MSLSIHIHFSLCFLLLLTCIIVLEPASLKYQLQSDSGTVAEKSRSYVGENSRADESKVLTVSSSRSDRIEARVSSSAHEKRLLIFVKSLQNILTFLVYKTLLLICVLSEGGLWKRAPLG